MSNQVAQQSNPFSTGGGGVAFEIYVQAYFTIQLIIQSPILSLGSEMRGQKIQFQAKYEDVDTDDFVITAHDGENQAKLLVQVKRNISFTKAEDSEFADTIKNAWSDFKKAKFSNYDKILLCTDQLAKVDIEHVIPTLEIAKASSSAEEFFKKFETKGFASSFKKTKLTAFRKQLDRANCSQITDDELLKFLQIFTIYAFDYSSSCSKDLQSLINIIQPYSTKEPYDVFNAVVSTVQSLNKNAGSIDIFSIPDDLRKYFDKDISNKLGVLELQKHAESILLGISYDINGIKIDRGTYHAEIINSLNNNKNIIVHGNRGVGKSGLVKSVIKDNNLCSHYFYFRVEDFAQPSFNTVLSSLGINMTWNNLVDWLTFIEKKIVVIESFEKILDFEDKFALSEFLRLIKDKDDWNFILTVRTHAVNVISMSLLLPESIDFCHVEVPTLNDSQVNECISKIQGLENIDNQSPLIQLFTTPYYIKLAVLAMQSGAMLSDKVTEQDFKDIIWSQVIAKESESTGGMPSKRRDIFMQIAIQRAKNMVFAVQGKNFLPDVVDKLVKDNLVLRDKNGFVSLYHDCLEDWALEEFIECEYRGCSSLKQFFDTIGFSPAINRGFRLWLSSKIQANVSPDILLDILSDCNIHSIWKDEAITSILHSHRLSVLLVILKSALLSNDCNLFKRFLFILSIACQAPSKELENLLPKKLSSYQRQMFLVPDGHAWDAVFKYIYEIRNELPLDFVKNIVDVLESWIKIININTDFQTVSNYSGLLILWVIEVTKDKYFASNFHEKIIKILLTVAPVIKEEFEALMEHELFRDGTLDTKKLRNAYILPNNVLLSLQTPLLCKHLPDFVIKIFYKEFFCENKNSIHHSSYDMRYSLEKALGLSNDNLFFPVSPLHGPFYFLLQHHFIKGLDFILNLCNQCSENFVHFLNITHPKDSLHTIILNDEKNRKYYALEDFWLGYCGVGNLPNILQAALMSLEKFLINLVEVHDIDFIGKIYEYILEKTNNIMPMAVLSSVAIGFPDKIGRAIFPVLKTYELYEYDFHRLHLGLYSSPSINPFSFLQRDVLCEVYENERIESAKYDWRKKSLEDLILHFQMSSQHKDEAFIIVEQLKKKICDLNIKERYFEHMIRRIDLKSYVPVKNEDGNLLLVSHHPEETPEFVKSQEKANIINRYCELRKFFDDDLVYSGSCSDYDGLILDAQRIVNEIKAENHVVNYEKSIIAFTASLCVRDNFVNLSENDKKWCESVIISEINNFDCLSSFSNRGEAYLSGIDVCISVLPKLLRLQQHTDVMAIKKTIVKILTCKNSQLYELVAVSIRDNLWLYDAELVKNYLLGMLEFSVSSKKSSNNLIVLADADGTYAEKQNRHILDFQHRLTHEKFNFNIDTYTTEHIDVANFYIPMLILPIGTNDKQHLDILDKVLNIVVELESLSHDDKHSGKFYRYDFKSICVCLAQHIIYHFESNSSEFNFLLRKLKFSAIPAPTFFISTYMQCNILLETKKDFQGMWKFWNLFSYELSEIINKYEDESKNLSLEYGNVLRHLLHLDAAEIKHENVAKIMKHGSHYLTEFARNETPSDSILSAMSSWMYSFHMDYFLKCLDILHSKEDEFKEKIIANKDAAFQIESSIGYFLQMQSVNSITIPRKQFMACLDILTIIFEAGSAEAYYLREHLTKSRKISG